ncbi:TrkH family potassium uptake protein [Miniphocaeibacter halophilus]|uniref:Trk family potassium uptake protein n=1 Tax=Miniphocaeibacter halophilus TaxID=2931922 RepID=A0AC61MSU8_9FIRM|nr:TrkH family potassium uptake protein [Miniphocaeibacter halophilus]QQK07519.1 Trk family potassium uptake protein [Miniphocaeibacter halophilus]
MKTIRKKRIIDNPSLYLVLGFFSVIIIGSFLLMLPISSADGTVGNYIDCLFVSTSNVCVTGLTPVVTATHWSTFGHVVIIILIQIGGLGIMTMSTLMALILGKRITLSSRLVIKEQLSADNMKGLVKLIKYVLASTFIIELVGAALLSISFIPEYGLGKGIWYSIFHSISSFCNAGFDILGDSSLTNYNSNALVMLTIAVLIILGGLGFNVYTNITAYKFNFKKYSLHAKIVLIGTAFLIVSVAIFIFIAEYNNPGTLKGLSAKDKTIASFFQSVTLRTAGYYSIDQAALHDSSAIISILAMFIGGAPASTAGGLKITTLALLIITVINEVKGNENIVVFNKSIRFEQVFKAITVFIIFTFWVLFVSIVIIIIEPFPPLDVFYEVVSATATVGISRGITPDLANVSKLLIILTMYLGRVGMLTLLFAFSKDKKKKQYKEAYGNIILG